MSKQFFVGVYDSAQDKPELVKSLGPYNSYERASRAEDGFERNMNHDRYFTLIREEDNE